MKMKKFLASLLSLTMLFTLTACSSSSDSSSDTSTESASTSDSAAESTDTAKNIAYITPSTTTPFWNWVEAGVQDACDEVGYTLTTYDSNNDSSTQLKNAQNAITAQMDAIVISPTDSASCGAVLDEAEAAGIPVVIVDIGTDEGTYLTTVSADNYGGAYQVGDYLGQYLQENGLEGSVGQITVELSRINGQLRTGGFEDALAEYGYEVTTTLESQDYTMDESDAQARNIVTANSDLVAIFANHDQASLGTLSALEDMGMLDDVVIVSFDGNSEIVEDLLNGDILCCGAQQAKKMGREGVYALETYFAGGDVPLETVLDVLFLTKDNVADYLDVIEQDVCIMD